MGASVPDEMDGLPSLEVTIAWRLGVFGCGFEVLALDATDRSRALDFLLDRTCKF